MDTALKVIIYGMAWLIGLTLAALAVTAAIGPAIAFMYFVIKLAGSF
jgi:hypothetical protein